MFSQEVMVFIQSSSSGIVLKLMAIERWSRGFGGRLTDARLIHMYNTPSHCDIKLRTALCPVSKTIKASAVLMDGLHFRRLVFSRQFPRFFFVLSLYDEELVNPLIGDSLASFFLVLLPMNAILAIKVKRPITPRAMPKLIAVFAPAKSLAEYMMGGSVVVDEVEDATEIGGVGAVRWEEKKDSTPLSIFHPKTPIAPTVDFAVTIVAAVAHAERLAGL
ncbi:hypothetical protein N431DRAFT_520640 [Stipitochalara longipes BDJ]|nr:hypothetical protein N431DRAFT_520640 [Stipitochalara longipes BDJ]